MKFPHKIPVLLKQACKVRKKAKSRAAQGVKKSFSARGRTAEPAVRSGPSTSSKASPSNLDPQASGGRLEDEKDVATPQDLSGLLDLEAEVDWGGTSSEASDSRADSQAPLEGEIPALQSPSRGMTRPRTPSRSPTRSSSHLGGMRGHPVAARAGLSGLCPTNTGATYRKYRPIWPEAEAHDRVDD